MREDLGSRALRPARAPVASLRSPRVRLRPVAMDDYDWLYETMTGPDGFRWRFRGTTPRVDSFPDQLWARVLTQYVVELVETGEPIALTAAYGISPSRYAHINVVWRPRARIERALEGLSLLIDHLFSQWDLRKLYIETFDLNADELRSGQGRYLHEEARLVAHDFLAGRHRDLVTSAVYRADWPVWCPGTVESGAEEREALETLDDLVEALRERVRLPEGGIEALTPLSSGVMDGLARLELVRLTDRCRHGLSEAEWSSCRTVADAWSAANGATRSVTGPNPRIRVIVQRPEGAYS